MAKEECTDLLFTLRKVLEKTSPIYLGTIWDDGRNNSFDSIKVKKELLFFPV